MMLCTNDLPWEPQLTLHVNPLCFDLFVPFLFKHYLKASLAQVLSNYIKVKYS